MTSILPQTGNTIIDMVITATWALAAVYTLLMFVRDLFGLEGHQGIVRMIVAGFVFALPISVAFDVPNGMAAVMAFAASTGLVAAPGAWRSARIAAANERAEQAK